MWNEKVHLTFTPNEVTVAFGYFSPNILSLFHDIFGKGSV